MKTNELVLQQYSTCAEWKIRLGSPRELFWELQRLLEKEGFECGQPQATIALESTPIEGHATFSNNVEGKKETQHRTIWRLILGILFCFTIVLIPIGVWLIRKSSYVVIEAVRIYLEGETFKASARSQEPYKAQSEVIDTVSNARVSLKESIYRKRGDGRIKSASQLEKQAFSSIRNDITERLNSLIHRIELHDVVERQNK